MIYLQKADSFMGICWEKTEKKWLFKRAAFCSGSIFLQCFNTCGISFLMFDKSVGFFRDRKIFIRRVFFF